MVLTTVKHDFILSGIKTAIAVKAKVSVQPKTISIIRLAVSMDKDQLVNHGIPDNQHKHRYRSE